MRKSLHAELMLVLVTFLWGLSFPVIKVATPFISPVLFVALRMMIATLILFAVWPALFGSYSKLLDKITIKWSILFGILLAVGYGTQTVGLHYTSPNNSAFITALSVVMVPVILFIFHKVKPSKFVGIGIVLALFGLALMTRPDLGQVNRGDVWTLMCALSYAIYLSRLNFALAVASYQVLIFWTLLFCTFLTGAWTLTIEEYYVTWNMEVIAGLIVTSILCTIVCLYLHNRYQRFTTATRAALIFSSEPVFAALFTWLFLKEGLSLTGFIGAMMILGAVLIAEIGGKKENKNIQP